MNEVVGGETPAARNLISGNTTGVDTFFGRATVEGNLIGTKANGTTALNNNDEGARVSGSNNIIEGNTIAFNGVYGVEVAEGIDEPHSTGNRILSNSIFSNGLMGIDLVGGVGANVGSNANDGGDGDTGPNNLQNYPLITSAQEVSPVIGTQIQFSLNSTPNSNFTIQFFASPEKDPSGHGEGKTFLGEMQVQTDGTNNTGTKTFAIDHSAASEGNIVTATATNNVTGDTSEFSLAKEVEPLEAQP